MSTFRVNAAACNLRQPEKTTPPVEVLVDTGAELTWLPADLLETIGVVRLRPRDFLTASRQRVRRDIGYAILPTEGYETIDEVVFAEPGDMNLLGVRTIEGFGVQVDNIVYRFISKPTLAV
jgi:predicted aspartyl protease